MFMAVSDKSFLSSLLLQSINSIWSSAVVRLPPRIFRPSELRGKTQAVTNKPYEKLSGKISLNIGVRVGSGISSSIRIFRNVSIATNFCPLLDIDQHTLLL